MPLKKTIHPKTVHQDWFRLFISLFIRVFKLPKKTTYLKDYTPCPFQILSVHLHFDIQHLNELVLSNDMHIKRLKPGRLELNGEDLELQAIYLDDNRYNILLVFLLQQR